MIILLFLLISLHLYAVDAIDITQLGTSADQIGRANIQGVGQSASSIFENPARLYTVDTWSLSLFSSQVLDSVDYLAVAGAIRTKNGVFALGRVGAGVQDIPVTTGVFSEAGELIGIETLSLFEYGSYVYKAAYQYSPTQTWSVGMSLNYYYVKAGDALTGNGVNADLGIFHEFSQYPIAISGVIENIIPDQVVRYAQNNASEILPRRYTLGAQYTLSDKYTLLSEVKRYDFHTDYFISGALEYTPFSTHRDLKGFVARTGYRQFPISPIQKRQTMTVGLGMTLGVVQFDYAYQLSDHDDYELQHYFSVGLNF